MAKIKHFSKDGLLTGEYTEIETQGVFAEWLVENYKEGDAFTVFKGEPCVENDITHNEYELLKDGCFVVTDTPSEPATIALVVSLVISVAVVALAPKPQLPDNVSRNRQQESPNNQLGSRSNQARPLQRIPDIRGKLLSVPDVIMPNYSMYENGEIEVEHGYYCVGRKRVKIEKVKDGDTPLELLERSSSAGIYYPNKNPNNTSSPDEQIGNAIERKIYTPFRSNQVNGITLSPDIERYEYSEADDIYFTGSGVGPTFMAFGLMNPNPNQTRWLAGVFVEGNLLELDNVVVNGQNISGNYVLTAGSGLYFSNTPFGRFYYARFDLGSNSPLANSDYELPTTSTYKVIGSGADDYTQWAYITKDFCRLALINVIAQNGLYKDDGGDDLIEAAVEYEVEFQEVDENDNRVGNIITATSTITAATQRLQGQTIEYDFISQGGKSGPIKFAARVKRLTPRDTDFNGTVVDEIKLEDLYGLADLPSGHNFGDITTIQTKTTATPFATAVKNRELNLIATEMLYPYLGNGSFSGTLTENNNAIQSFITDSIDPVIGNRTLEEIDADGILALKAEIDSYFGNTSQTEFSYTFDSTDITYQDYAQTVFNAINCIAYREGSLISARFEKPQTIPAMLFTHRSKLPSSETYTRNFNASTINDGVEFNYVDPATNTTETIYLNNGNSVNPKVFNIAGIRSLSQANIRAAREWNKIRYSKLSCEVSVTAEGRYVRPMDMVSIVKGTRINTFDGEVIAVNGLELTLSQDVVFIPGDAHSIILKNNDGTTDGINCIEGSESNIVLLNSAPQQAIRTGIEGRRTEFSFGNDAKQEAQQWIVQDIDLTDKLSVQLKAINYSDQYYIDDI